MEERLVLN